MIQTKKTYLARGDSLQSGGHGPDQPVVGTNQIMTAPRFETLQVSTSEVQRFIATIVQHGGYDNVREGRLFTDVHVSEGANPGVVSILPRPPVTADDYDLFGRQICGWVPTNSGAGSDLQVGSGFLLDTTTAVNLVDVPYAAEAATEYTIYFGVGTVPSKSEINTETGVYEFTQETAISGAVETPSSVAYDGVSNELTMTLPLTLAGGNASNAGRSYLAWYTAPQGETSTAVQFTTATWDGANNQLVFSGAFGQNLSGVDLDELNYRVAIMGPLIVEGDLGLSPGVARVAYGSNASGWDMDVQTRFPSIYEMLQGMVRMTAQSSNSDGVSRPKISVRPNDNEDPSELQIAVYDDAAGSSLVFGIDKAGNLFYGGDLLGTPGSPLSFGVDTANIDIETGLEIFHSHTGGVGQDLKGVRVGLALETNIEGNREEFGGVSALARDVTDAAAHGALILSSVFGSAHRESVYISRWGESYFGPDVRTQVGPGTDFDPFSTSLQSSVIAVGAATQNAITSFNTIAADGVGARGTAFDGQAIQSGGSVHTQFSARGLADEVGTGFLSRLSLSVNDGAGATSLAEALSLEYESDPVDSDYHYPINRANELRPLSKQAVRVGIDSAARTGKETHLTIVQSSTGSLTDMRTNNARAKMTWDISSTTFSGETSFIASGPTVGGYDIELGAIHGGTDESLLNVHSAGGAGTSYTLIQSLNEPTPQPFLFRRESSLIVVKDRTQKPNAGIDIADRAVSDADGGRSTFLNALGRTGVGTEGRLGGMRFHHDADLGTTDHAGKVVVFANQGATVDGREFGIELYSTGYVRSQGTATWASVDASGSSAALISQSGVASVARTGIGVYQLTLATPLVGAAAAVAPIFVQLVYQGVVGNFPDPSWISDSIVQVRTIDSSGTLTDDIDFSMAAFAPIGLRSAPL